MLLQLKIAIIYARSFCRLHTLANVLLHRTQYYDKSRTVYLFAQAYNLFTKLCPGD